MSGTKGIQGINEKEMKGNLVSKGSWHDQYSSSPTIAFDKGDNRLSRYGEVVDVNLVCEKETGASRGFAFLAYANQKSSILAVDNLNGIEVSGRQIRVDHVLDYKSPEARQEERIQRFNRKEKYSEMISEDLFSRAFASFQSSGQLKEEMGSDIIRKAPESGDHDSKPKRLRTAEEAELRKKFLDGTISEAEYLNSKRKLKMALRSKN